MDDKYLLIRWSDGRTGAVLPSKYADKDMAAYFEGSTVVSYEDGTPFEPEPVLDEEKPAHRRAAKE